MVIQRRPRTNKVNRMLRGNDCGMTKERQRFICPKEGGNKQTLRMRNSGK
jgi:hypothetical protein